MNATITETAETTELQYDDQAEDGRWYRLDEAQVGWLVGEEPRNGEFRSGLITALHGGGFTYADADAGRERFVSFADTYAVACPVDARPETAPAA